ncbi:hypothetical protein D0C36_22560 [Mucilaginibacter conchicola]|uniref:Uncharacterized protein n=1 Tax=Mucilaginibacter conchicola TaxID=2303333 RepID=A0A372NNP0_9SPHI|nr:hypothetical protein [Mucilaginibacter conchicola]RFZ90562.1 hypothetical protein D0C36_22560 [Mucilaginibacter conchicola]
MGYEALVDVLFLFPQKKKYQKENSRLGNALQGQCCCSACTTRTLHYVAFFGGVWSLLFIFLLVSKKASGESGYNAGGQCGGKGIAILAEAQAKSERSGSKILQPVVLTALQGKGLEQKEASLLYDFLVTF